MTITTQHSDNTLQVTVTDAGKHFSFELDIHSVGNRTWIDYTNSEDVRFNLLNVDESGYITNEVPVID